MEKELRRSESTLQILGSGVIVFAVWDIIKPSLAFLLGTNTQEQAEAAESTGEPSMMIWLILALIVLLIFVNLPLRFYIGHSARAEGRGKQKGWTYVVLAFIIFGIQAAAYLFSVYETFFVGAEDEEAVAALLLETCSVVTTGQTAFTAVKVKKLRKKLAAG